METKFKLRVTSKVYFSARKVYNVTRSFVWTDKADALACKALLEKAAVTGGHPGDTKIEFVEFTEERPLA